MVLTFNLLLREAGVDPGTVRLLRHETGKYRGRTPYSLWRDDPAKLERYQSTQQISRRAWFRGTYWASFVVTPDDQTLFVGLYRVGEASPISAGWFHDLNDQPLDAELDEQYDLMLSESLRDLIGRLVIDWGAGTRSWVQLAANQDKPIVELRKVFVEPPFPGYTSFIGNLSEVLSFPQGWQTALAAVRGVYLLTCPRTREQYVGSATGPDGLFGRWLDYTTNGHGGNVGLRSRDPSDYQVSILQVAGSGDSADAVLNMEAIWKAKLQSREMGLNRN